MDDEMLFMRSSSLWSTSWQHGCLGRNRIWTTCSAQCLAFEKINPRNWSTASCTFLPLTLYHRFPPFTKPFSTIRPLGHHRPPNGRTNHWAADGTGQWKWKVTHEHSRLFSKPVKSVCRVITLMICVSNETLLCGTFLNPFKLPWLWVCERWPVKCVRSALQNAFLLLMQTQCHR